MRLREVVLAGVFDSTPIHVLDWFPTRTNLAGDESNPLGDGIHSQAVTQRRIDWFQRVAFQTECEPKKHDLMNEA
ncbi:hypothetical protein RE6C_01761 [Rhodopirellula europaea 6C]|uniref:Uncharacterized protein n=1 Tax=Rhodopirellula europaea 6C TaxID=1263867 RepID=M2AK64_9BACT|nr:hypothetical protein RE6C_01761 [Rhodopirellula europaea 6C]